ncbi:quinone oxidoreductase family protein [Virgibacillus senegalensis]|uniref:quinone oxidoreductase family protein n=1 Tax=Virgibacillus senegalensis TaxID=1499679 RepID=UPI00069F3589|nr:NADPH:quinone oxidoreductase family protein [Virgibacillus senegalensis]
MKGIVVKKFGGPEALELVEMEVPKIKENEVLIKVVNTSVNYADIKNRSGRKWKGPMPFVPGLDAAGIVVEIGDKVNRFKIGDRVICFPRSGSYADYAVASEKLTFSITEKMDFISAAACPTVGFLSYHLLKKIAHINEGESVLVHAAAGGVGSTAVQLAKLMGAGLVIGTVSREEKQQMAKEAGADHVIGYENFADSVNRITNGKGIDIILDSVSGRIFEESLDCLSHFGRLVHFGNSSGSTGMVETKQLHASCRSVLGFSLGTTRKERPEILQETASGVLQYIESGQLDIKVGKKLPLKAAREAHQLLESRTSVGKIILEIE